MERQTFMYWRRQSTGEWKAVIADIEHRARIAAIRCPTISMVEPMLEHEPEVRRPTAKVERPAISPPPARTPDPASPRSSPR